MHGRRGILRWPVVDYGRGGSCSPEMNPSSVLVTGSNRGIGLELVKQLLQNKNTHLVVATCRAPSVADELITLKNENTKLQVLELDVCSDSDIERVASELSEGALSSCGLGLLINNAGVSLKGLGSIAAVTREAMRESFEVNTISPLMVTKAFTPLLKKAAKEARASRGELTEDFIGAGVLNISSELGSIARCTWSGTLSYRISKTGLNMLSRCLHLDLIKHHVGVVSVHPGWVRTDLGGARAPLTVQQSVNGILQNVVASFDKNMSGSFVDYNGKHVEY